MIECNYERGAEMTTEEIVQNYQVKLLKIIFKEMYAKLSALAEIDRLFHWSSRLHQEQLKFVSKYPNVMEKYRQAN